jgi:hypothetical protein
MKKFSDRSKIIFRATSQRKMNKKQEINKGESPEIAIKIAPNNKASQKTTKKIVLNTVKNKQFHSNLKKPTTIWLKAHKNRMETKTKKT